MIKINPIWTFEIADLLGAERPLNNYLIDSISIDSRENFDGNVCFFAIKGDTFDGEVFIDEAIQKGAKCIVSTKKTGGDVSFITTFNAKNDFLRLSSVAIGSTKIIGVTGSVGKTTVKEMISSVLSQAFKVRSTYENHNNEIGVAKTLFSISNEDFCVVEMGMRGEGEIDVLSKACEPYISIITNVGSSHIGRLGSEENIFKAKCEILNYTKKYAIVPSEKRFKKINYRHILPLFMGKDGDLELISAKHFEKGIVAEVIDNNFNKVFRLEIPSVYLHDAENAMIACCVGKLCGLTESEIKKGISEFKNCKNRGKILTLNKLTIIDDCYNASFESTRGAISSLMLYTKANSKTPYLLMGDMLELGERSSEYHKKIGAIAKEKGIFNVFCYGEYAKFVCEGFGGGVEFSSIEVLKEYIIRNLGEGDVLLVKASRNAHFEKIIEDLKESINEG